MPNIEMPPIQQTSRRKLGCLILFLDSFVRCKLCLYSEQGPFVGQLRAYYYSGDYIVFNGAYTMDIRS